MSARKKPVLPQTFSMNAEVPNPFGHAIMGILQAKLEEVRQEFPHTQLKAIFVMESEDCRAHTQFRFMETTRLGDKYAFVSMNEYYLNDEPGAWRFFDLWLHTDKVDELFSQAGEDDLLIAANTVWAHLLPQAQK